MIFDLQKGSLLFRALVYARIPLISGMSETDFLFRVCLLLGQRACNLFARLRVPGVFAEGDGKTTWNMIQNPARYMRCCYRELLKLNFRIALSNEKERLTGFHPRAFFHKEKINIDCL